MRDRLASIWRDSPDPARVQERLPVVDSLFGVERNQIVLIKVTRVGARGLDVVVSDQDLPGAGWHEGFASYRSENLLQARITGTARRGHLLGKESSHFGQARGPRRPPLDSILGPVFVVEHAFRSGRALHPGDGAIFFDLDANSEIKPIDVERHVHVLRMQIRSGRIVKTRDLAAR